jgi:hypothetical protein
MFIIKSRLSDSILVTRKLHAAAFKLTGPRHYRQLQRMSLHTTSAALTPVTLDRSMNDRASFIVSYSS